MSEEKYVFVPVVVDGYPKTIRVLTPQQRFDQYRMDVRDLSVAAGYLTEALFERWGRFCTIGNVEMLHHRSKQAGTHVYHPTKVRHDNLLSIANQVKDYLKKNKVSEKMTTEKIDFTEKVNVQFENGRSLIGGDIEYKITDGVYYFNTIQIARLAGYVNPYLTFGNFEFLPINELMIKNDAQRKDNGRNVSKILEQLSSFVISDMERRRKEEQSIESSDQRTLFGDGGSGGVCIDTNNMKGIISYIFDSAGVVRFKSSDIAKVVGYSKPYEVFTASYITLTGLGEQMQGKYKIEKLNKIYSELCKFAVTLNVNQPEKETPVETTPPEQEEGLVRKKKLYIDKFNGVFVTGVGGHTLYESEYAGDLKEVEADTIEYDGDLYVNLNQVLDNRTSEDYIKEATVEVLECISDLPNDDPEAKELAIATLQNAIKELESTE